MAYKYSPLNVFLLPVSFYFKLSLQQSHFALHTPTTITMDELFTFFNSEDPRWASTAHYDIDMFEHETIGTYSPYTRGVVATEAS